ncbi:MAG: MFS transporter [Desulfovibrio sp.]|nr:MFS transporter [Desulfovibrio sp.]
MDKGKIILLSLAHTSADVNSSAVPALLPFLAAAFGYSYTEAAAVVFCHSLVSALAQPAVGWVSDKRQCTWFIPFSILLLAACFSGLGASLFHPEAASLTNILAGERKGAAMSLFAIGGNAGFVLGPVFVGLLVPVYGLHATMLFPLLALLTATSFLIAFRRMPQLKKLRRQGTATGQANNWRAFSWLACAIVARAVVTQGFYGFIAFYWIARFGATAQTGSWMLACFAVLGAASGLAGGLISDRLGYVATVRCTQLFLLPLVLLFSWTDSPWLAGALLAPIAFCLYGSHSPMIVLGQTFLARTIGMAAGVNLGIATTAGGVAMPGLGLVADSYGLTTSFFCLSGLALASLLCSLKLPQTRIDRKARTDRAEAQAEGEAKAESAAKSTRDAMSGEG